MAEFCSQCSPFNGAFDINLFKIATSLKNGYSQNFLCEGCNNRAVYKDEDGALYLAKAYGKEIKLESVKIEDLMP